MRRLVRRADRGDPPRSRVVPSRARPCRPRGRAPVVAPLRPPPTPRATPRRTDPRLRHGDAFPRASASSTSASASLPPPPPDLPRAPPRLARARRPRPGAPGCVPSRGDARVRGGGRRLRPARRRPRRPDARAALRPARRRTRAYLGAGARRARGGREDRLRLHPVHHRRAGEQSARGRAPVRRRRRVRRRVPRHHVHRRPRRAGLHGRGRRVRRSEGRGDRRVLGARSEGGVGARAGEGRGGGARARGGRKKAAAAARGALGRRRRDPRRGGRGGLTVRPPRRFFLRRIRAVVPRGDGGDVPRVDSGPREAPTRGSLPDHHRRRRDGARLGGRRAPRRVRARSAGSASTATALGACSCTLCPPRCSGWRSA